MTAEKRTALRKVVLDLLANPSIDRRVGRGIHYFYPAVQLYAEPGTSPRDVLEVCWQLMADGLLFIDFTEQPTLDNSEWRLTERGVRAAQSEDDYEPDDPDGYLELLERRLGDVDAGVKAYVSEAVRAYAGRCYLASSVMLGVASERAFQLLADAFVGTLAGSEAEGFRVVLVNPRQTFVAKFREFRKRIEPRRGQLPDGLSENLILTLDAVLDLLRVARNDSGHPTGRYIDKQDAYVNLQLFGRYMEKLDSLRRHFLAQAPVSA